MATLLITKETGGYFSFVVDGNTADKVTNMRNDVLAVGNICHFKTANGANIIKTQNVLVTDITLVESGSFTFSDVNTFLSKLIDVGYYDWLLGGGSGTGTNRFDELLDTFDYFGNDMKAVRVNESQLKLEPFTVYNYRNITDLEDTFSTIVPNKMLATSADGTKVELRDIPAEPEQFLNAVGSFHYSDLATQTTPLNATANTELKITNDTLGDFTNTSNAPFGVSSLYNATTNQFDFSQLAIGDIVHFRPDLVIDEVGTNTSYRLFLRMGIGSPQQYDLEVSTSERKDTTAFNKTSFIGFDISNAGWRDYPAEFYFKSDANATVKNNGYYFEVIRKNVNVVEVISGSDPLKENLSNKQNSLAIDGTGTKYPTVDAVNAALPKTYTTTVYVNTNDPNTATVFDDENPPVTNDDGLKSNTDNLYIGSDASTWVYNGSVYATKIVPATSNFNLYNTSIDAGNNKESIVERFGAIASKSGNIVRKNGSDSVLGGGYFSFYNNAITDGNTFQLNALNGLDLWNFASGTWNKRFTFSSDGDLTGNSFIKSGGTSSQFLKADGGVDNTSYQSSLVSGTNIKTLDGDSLLGSGNLLPKTELAYALADETANLTVSTRLKFRMPFAMTLSEVRISLNDAPTLSSVVVDVKENGVSIFSTLLSIDANEKTSVTAATPAVISDINLADDAEITVSTTQIGSGDTGKGLKILFKGRKA